MMVLAYVHTSAFALSPDQVFNKASPAVVVIEVYDAKDKSLGLGSGVVIGSDEVITNCHVAKMKGGKVLRVRRGKVKYGATLHFADPSRDLCQLTVPNLPIQPIERSSTQQLRVGQRVFAIGAPLGLDLTLSEGLISSLRFLEGAQYIQTSAAISHGSSGGGLFDDNGRLVGVTTFYLKDSQSLNFALPVDWIAELPMRANGEVLPPLAKESNSTSLNTAPPSLSSLDISNEWTALEGLNNWKGVLDLAQRLEQQQPNHQFISLMRCDASLGLSLKAEISLQYCRKATKDNPSLEASWRNLSLSHLMLGDYTSALNAANEAIRVDPTKSYKTYLAKFRALSYLGRYAESVEVSRIATKLFPTEANAKLMLAGGLLELEQVDEAAELLYDVLLKFPACGRCFLYIGTINFKKQDFKSAATALERATIPSKNEFDVSDESSLWSLLSLTYLFQSKYVFSAAQKALDLDRNNPDAYSAMCGAFIDLERFDEGLAACREAIRLDPNNIYAPVFQAVTYAKQGAKTKAREVIAKEKIKHPEEAEHYRQLESKF